VPRTALSHPLPRPADWRRALPEIPASLGRTGCPGCIAAPGSHEIFIGKSERESERLTPWPGDQGTGEGELSYSHPAEQLWQQGEQSLPAPFCWPLEPPWGAENTPLTASLSSSHRRLSPHCKGSSLAPKPHCTPKRSDPEGGSPGTGPAWSSPSLICKMEIIKLVAGVWGGGLKGLRHHRKVSKEIWSLLASRGNASLLAGLQPGVTLKRPPPARGLPAVGGTPSLCVLPDAELCLLPPRSTQNHARVVEQVGAAGRSPPAPGSTSPTTRSMC